MAAWHPGSGEWKALEKRHGDMCSIHHMLFSGSCSFSLSQASKVRWSEHVRELYSIQLRATERVKLVGDWGHHKALDDQVSRPGTVEFSGLLKVRCGIILGTCLGNPVEYRGQKRPCADGNLNGWPATVAKLCLSSPVCAA